ncbi:MAG: ribosomal protein S18-alanine N-acetyltransferase [Firmicutes bacterium]|jgi:ribosomal-protein-alanine N-acetyltransferase|nr:ribosomal protein S18-alanine N-acetyltransferase [Bacillota bacterium]
MKFCHVDAVAEIEKKVYQNPWTKHAFINEILDNGFAYYYVALAEGKVVGYGGIWVILDEAHVTNLAVSPAWQGKGIGKALLAHLIKEAAGKGASRMTLEVRVSNLRAQALYQKFGFVPCGIRPKYYHDEDALVMWLTELRYY